MPTLVEMHAAELHAADDAREQGLGQQGQVRQEQIRALAHELQTDVLGLVHAVHSYAMGRAAVPMRSWDVVG